MDDQSRRAVETVAELTRQTREGILVWRPSTTAATLKIRNQQPVRLNRCFDAGYRGAWRLRIWIASPWPSHAEAGSTGPVVLEILDDEKGTESTFPDVAGLEDLYQTVQAMQGQPPLGEDFIDAVLADRDRKSKG